MKFIPAQPNSLNVASCLLLSMKSRVLVKGILMRHVRARNCNKSVSIFISHDRVREWNLRTVPGKRIMIQLLASGRTQSNSVTAYYTQKDIEVAPNLTVLAVINGPARLSPFDIHRQYLIKAVDAWH